MRVASSMGKSGRLSMEISGTGYGDAMPMVRRIYFDGLDAAPASAGLVLASAVLVADYCGEVLEFANLTPGVGFDVLDAVRGIVDVSVNIHPISAADRALSVRNVDVAAAEARDLAFWRADIGRGDGTFFSELHWSGDPVDHATRSSRSFRNSGFSTNAALVAAPHRVSIAFALLKHGLTIRDLWVAGADQRLVSALGIVGIGLQPAQLSSG